MATIPHDPRSALQQLLHRTDALLCHLSRILSTPSGTDTTLLTLAYTLNLLQNRLHHHLNKQLARVAAAIADKASSSLLPGETIIASVPAPAHVARLSRAADAAKRLSALIGDFRVFSRLWGLLGVYAWARSIYLSPPRDALVRRVTWAQVLACAAYQYLENGAYLARHGVLRWDAAKQARRWAWSCRFWAAHVALEFARLARVWYLREREAAGAEKGDEMAQKGAGVRRREERARWLRELLINCAWTPLTVHWSLEGGAVDEAWVGFLGGVVGVLRFRELWKRTA